MRLSTRSTYGMRALVELGLAQGRGPLSVALIAKQQGLSVAYLEQLLHRLKKQGVVMSMRGPKGGYLLAREPEQITVAEIVRILDGEVEAPNGNAQNGHASSAPRAGQASRHAQRIAQAVFHGVHQRLAHALERVTLRDLCEEAQHGDDEPLDHRYVFHI